MRTLGAGAGKETAMLNLIGVLALLLFQGVHHGMVTDYDASPTEFWGGQPWGANSGNNFPMASVTFEATGEKNFDSAPRWLRNPEPRALGSVFPARAMQDG